MTSTTPSPATFCPSCGQPVPPPPRLCVCGEPDLSHDLARDGTTRTKCLRIRGPEGKRCPCLRFEVAEVTSGR